MGLTDEIIFMIRQSVMRGERAHVGRQSAWTDARSTYFLLVQSSVGKKKNETTKRNKYYYRFLSVLFRWLMTIFFFLPNNSRVSCNRAELAAIGRVLNSKNTNNGLLAPTVKATLLQSFETYRNFLRISPK